MPMIPFWDHLLNKAEDVPREAEPPEPELEPKAPVEIQKSCTTCAWGGAVSLVNLKNRESFIQCRNRASPWFGGLIARGYSKHDRCKVYEEPTSEEVRAFLALMEGDG